MAFLFKRRVPYIVSLLPIKSYHDLDKPVIETYTNKNHENETGMDRIKRVFSKDEYDDLTPELRFCIHMTSLSVFVGGICGGVMRGKSAFLTFIENNEATMFQNHLDAKRRLQDKVAIGVGKGAFQMGWRCSLFTSAFVFTSTLMSAFRGQSGVIEFVAAGLLAGTLYNLKNGWRGGIVGGALGASLGTVYGVICYVYLLSTGKTMEDLRYMPYERKKINDSKMAEMDKERRVEEDEDAIIELSHELTRREVVE